MSPAKESLPGELWQLCQRASSEKDPVRLLQLVQRINRLLAQREGAPQARKPEEKKL